MTTAAGWEHKFSQGDAPDPAAGEWVLDGLNYSWEVADFPAEVQPDPSPLSFTLYREIGGPPALEEGTDLIVRIEHADLPTNTSGAVLAMFRGRVTDMVGRPSGDGMAYSVTVIDRLAGLNQASAVAEAAPAETTEARITRQFALAGQADNLYWPHGVAHLAAEDIEPGPLLDLIKDTYRDDWGYSTEAGVGDLDRNLSRHSIRYMQRDLGGGEGQENPAMWMDPWYDDAIVWERQYDQGVYRLLTAGGVWFLSLEPFPGARATVLPASAILVDDIEWKRSQSQPNRAEVTGRFGTVAYQDSGRVASQGVISVRRPESKLDDSWAAQAAVQGLVGDAEDARPRWRFDRFTVRPDLLEDRGVALAGSALFPPVLWSHAYDYPYHPNGQGVTCIGRTMLVTGIAPQWSPEEEVDVAGRLTAATLSINGGHLTITCSMAPRLPRPWNPTTTVDGPSRQAPLRWSDLRAKGNPTWAQLDRNITWAQLRLARAE